MKTEQRKVTRIAMWSGPRNISTALMRAWENRSDTVVIDEPFYAYFLRRSGRQHPGREEVLAAQPADWRTVVERLQAPLPAGRAIHYQKQMTHHLDESVSLDWLAGVRNCFLIRKPLNMLASLLKVLPNAELADTGLPQQLRLFEHVRSSQTEIPPVIDTADVLQHPGAMLRALCAALDVPFSENMLRWPAGRRDSDGVWAPYWYAAVEKSTGFAPWRPATPEIPPQKIAVLEQCQLLYDRIAEYRLQAIEGDS
ncbi:MAG: HAD family hydrolase [Gammaproteobacteria bacterium]|nr:HAD family hydrolase [Gammaproteobacteria bacterium]MDH3768728.1 HAD family hydrolase [Gammaproteobacteria bacterium]